MLNASRKFNDYDYALVHLFERDQEYYDFFKKSLITLGRDVLLDNSLFELGETFDPNKFAVWIDRLHPTEYIIPDAFNDCTETIRLARQWDKDFKNIPGKKIAVIHGTTYDEYKHCYRELYPIADKIAINFADSYFYNTGEGETTALRIANGRQKLIDRLIDDDVWDKYRPHHLLGATVPQEFKHYRYLASIESIDTSNPIVHGARNILYSRNGLRTKLSVKLNDIFYEDISLETFVDILYNVKKFRDIIYD
jgi:hypothetical protein